MLRATMAILGAAALALAGTCTNACAQAGSVKAVQGIVQRWFPEHLDRFVFVEIPKDPVGDVFEIESRGGRTFIRGNSGVSMASGLNWYLKYYCNVNITWFASQTRLPKDLPVVPSKVRQVTPYTYRYIFNYCEFSYSLAWFGWPQWERLIDWMALHGINMPLAITGQEAVWRDVYRKLGLSDKQLDQFFTGAGFLPFGWMGCVDGWGGPLPESWYGKRVALQKRILERERSFGMTPVLQGFTGHVPKAIKDVYPGVKLHQTAWNAFDPTYFLDPLDPLFVKIGCMVVKEEARLFGTDHLYSSDTFIEMKPDSNDPEFLAAFSRAIYGSMSSADPEAVWVMQDWFFAYDAVLNLHFWELPQTRALLTAVPQGRILMLEMAWFWQDKEAFCGQPWVFTHIQNWGGVPALYGSLDGLSDQIFTCRESAQRGNHVGLGMTDEGLEYNSVFPDFITDMTWRAERPDMSKWTSDYLLRRYGQKDEAIDDAWQIMRKTVGNSGPYGPITCVLLASGPRQGPGYDNKELAKALDLYLQAAGRLGDRDTYRFDLLHLERQVLGNFADRYFDQVSAAVAEKDLKALDLAGDRMLGLIDDMDRLAGTRKDFMLGPWLADARSWGDTEDERRYYEWNARNILTTWGPAQSGCYHYARREWSGLLKGFYRKRWEKYLHAQMVAIRSGKPLDEAAFLRELRFWEDSWGHQHQKYATEPSGDTVKVARDLWSKYRPEVFASGTIVGKVMDPVTGEAIPGAVVAASARAKAVSDATGSYSLSDLSAGRYVVCASAVGYRPFRANVVIEKDGTVTTDCALIRLGAPSVSVSDSFARPDGVSLGSTEDKGRHPWIIGNCEYAPSISSQVLYMAGWTKSPLTAVSVGGLQAADIDATVRLRLGGDPSGWGAGIVYRNEVPAVFAHYGGQTRAQSGYAAFLRPNKTVSIYVGYDAWVGDVPLGESFDTSAWHTMRVRAIGCHHQVWVDGVKYIDAVDTSKLTGGFVGLLCHRGTNAWFDDLQIDSYAN